MQPYISNGLRALRRAAAVGAAVLAMVAPAFGQYTTLPEAGKYRSEAGDISCDVTYRDFDGTLIATGEPMRLQIICSSDRIPGVKLYSVTAINGKPRGFQITGINGRKKDFQLAYTPKEDENLTQNIKEWRFHTKVVTSDSFVGNEAVQIFREMEKIIDPKNIVKW